ncbi:MAG: hypothetical protein ACLQQ4_02590 [Bacteroidia bacterium]
MRNNKKIKSFIILFSLWALPFFANACATCQAGGTPRTRNAYLVTTIILISVPFISGGSIFYWLYSKRKHQGE